MKCPFCGFDENKVVDSRDTSENEKIRRRRECLKCKERFTTYEVIEDLPIIVIKKDKSRQTFNRNKILNGMIRACEGCEVTLVQLENAIENIEKLLRNSMDREVTSKKIGELVMDELKTINDVAYVRYASVYREFKDVNTFMDELSKLLKDKGKY